MDSLNQVYEWYDTQIGSGFGLIAGDVNWLLSSLIIISLVLSAFIWMFGDQAIVQFARKVFFVSLMIWIIENWVMLTDILSKTFIELGIKAGNSPISGADALNPGDIAIEGFIITYPIMLTIGNLSGPYGFFANIAEILLLLIAIIAILIAYAVMAIQIIVALLSFKIGTLVAFVLTPFSLLRGTSFIAERPLGWVVGAAVRLMLLTLVIGIGQNLVLNFGFIPGKPVPATEAWNAALASIVLMVLALQSSRIASEIVGGQPQFSGSDAIASTALTVGVAAAVAKKGASSSQSSVRDATSLDDKKGDK